MIVLDANILIRAVLGKRVGLLLEEYAGYGIRFYAPESAYREAEEYLPSLLRKKGDSDTGVAAALRNLQRFVEPIDGSSYEGFAGEAKHRLRGRDEEDWPVLAAALALACPIWTEDTDFFGIGVAVWNTARVEIFLKAQAESLESEEE